jgi:hypothetical protein
MRAYFATRQRVEDMKEAPEDMKEAPGREGRPGGF